MFKKMIAAIEEEKRAAEQRVRDVLERVDDPVARQTSWTPASSGNGGVRTHEFGMISPGRAEFRLSKGTQWLCLGMFGFGLAGLGVGGAMGAGLIPAVPGWWLGVSFGFVFAIAGAGMRWELGRPRVFDMDELRFWRGRKPRDRAKVDAFATPLDEVHAGQLLASRPRADRDSPFNYEINLVRHDGERAIVIDHQNLERIREDGAAIAELIGVPVWDATE